MKSSFLSPKHPAPNPELLDLRAELIAAQEELAVAHCQFDQAVDPDLVEACIYRINSIKARCNYLIRAIKACSPELAAAAQDERNPVWT